jgi:tetratricopeptide (TPR) repeat protein
MKTKLFLTSLLGMASFQIACSVAPTKVDVADQLQEKTKIYKITVKSVSESDVKPGQCYRQVTQLKAQWNWKQAVTAANSCMRSKDFQHVEEMGNELAVREPAAPWGPYYLGLAARENGNLERALWMAELALKRAPDVGVLHYLKAQILWSKKDYKAAVSELELTVNDDETNLPAQLFLGQIYFRDQDFSRASQHFAAALKINSNHVGALSGLAEAQLHENNPQGALESFGRLTEIDPHDGQYLSRMGEIYESVLNDIPGALGAYHQLQIGVRAGKISKNVDPQNDAKVRELEISVQKSRALASTQEKRSAHQ